MRALGAMALLLAACSGIRPPDYRVVDAHAVAPAEPQPSRLERWLLRRGSSEIVFTLAVERESDARFRFAALDDFGGTLAEGDQDGVTRDSRALPRSIAERIGTLTAVRTCPRWSQAVLVGETPGWADPERGALHYGDSLFVDGMRARRRPDGAVSVDGSLRATVTLR